MHNPFFATKASSACLAVGCAVVLSVAAPATAGSLHEFGSLLHNVTVTNLTPDQTFGANFTGSLGLSANSNTTYGGALLDGVFVGNPHFFAFFSIDGQIDFADGSVTGGFMNFTIGNPATADPWVFNTFTADVAGAEPTGPLPGGPFTVAASLTNITFDTGAYEAFAGFDIADFLALDNVRGSFAFTYDGSLVDDTSTLIATAVIPLPAAAWMGLVGLAGIGLLRRRRLPA